MTVVLLYLGVFTTLRLTGVYYAYYSQGTWELEYTGFDPAEQHPGRRRLDVPVFLLFYPLWKLDQAMLEFYNEEPAGG